MKLKDKKFMNGKKDVLVTTTSTRITALDVKHIKILYIERYIMFYVF